MFDKKKREISFSIDGVAIDITTIPDKSITAKQYEKVRANSYGFELMYPKLDNEALKISTENCLRNCMNHHPVTYDGVLQDKIVPELLKRLVE